MNRLRGFRYLICILAPIICCSKAVSQDGLEATDKRIIQEIRAHNHLMENLEYLSDRIGPRLTGSEQLRTAEIWSSGIAQQYGLENVHLESWKVAHSWRRGSAQARIVDPVVRSLTITSAGWSPGTDGEVKGKIVSVTAANLAELKTFSGKLLGSIVLLEQPSDLTRAEPIASPSSPFNGPDIQAPAPATNRKMASADDQFDSARLNFLKTEGVAAIILDSGEHNGLLVARNAGERYELAPIPTATVTHEDYSLVWRLLKKGSVEIELSLTNSFSESPVEVHNVVAEIRGAQIPEELVILCAHLDSWDLASGSTDDGTGVASVLEAARAIHALKLQPKRTIRIVVYGRGTRRSGLT